MGMEKPWGSGAVGRWGPDPYMCDDWWRVVGEHQHGVLAGAEGRCPCVDPCGWPEPRPDSTNVFSYSYVSKRAAR